MNRVHGLAAVAMAAVIVSGCMGQSGSAGIAESAATRAPASDAGAAKAAAAMDAFGLDFYKAYLAKGGNGVVSPASIVLALSMARAGAAGETATQMDAVLHSPVSSDLNSLDQALAAISGTFKDSNGKDAKVTLRIANAPFAQIDLTFKAPFLDTLKSDYGAGLRLVDYKANASAACEEINGWVKDQTEGRIPQLLDSVDPLTRLVLVNAIYMKAPWASQFKVESTEPEDFTRLDGSKVSVQMMNQSLPASYAAGSGWKAAELPYLGGSLAMDIIVPDDLVAFESGLSGASFAQITGALKRTQVTVAMPKFKAETKADLASTLAKMGMPLAFDDGKADLSGMTADAKLSIFKVIHEANIDVDENGTEASAATAVQMGETAFPGGLDSEPVVRADRPFMYAVRDTKTGAILFLGRVIDPPAR